VAGATPLPKNGVARPPPFWPRGGFGHPIQPVWGGSQAFGGGPATPKATKKKKKKKKNEMGLCRWGWPDHPQGPGVASATPYDHTQALGGGPATPNDTNPFRFFFFFFFLVAFGVAGPPPFWPRGWLQPPRFPLFLFLFYFIFFRVFLKKKKKKKLKSEMGQNYAVLGEPKTA
jgi:hypothetical protein